MTLALEHLATTDSPLSRLDPRWKLAALTIAAVSVTLLRALPAVALALAGAVALAILCRRHWSWYFRRLGAALLVTAAFAGPLPFLIDGPGWHLDLGPLTLSKHGLMAAAVLAGKMLTILLLTTVLLITAPWSVTLKAAHDLHVPGLLVQLVDLTYRYLFVLGGELVRLRLALRVRGFRGRATRHGYRTMAHVGGTLLVRGYERAERVSQAMRCRGFDGRFRALTAFRSRVADAGFFVAVTGAAVGLLAWEWSLR